MQEVRLIKSEPDLEIELKGDICAENADDFYNEVIEHYAGKGNVIFECSALEFIDSTTLGTFVKILKKVKTAGGSLKITALSERLKKLFVICALDKIMEID